MTQTTSASKLTALAFSAKKQGKINAQPKLKLTTQERMTSNMRKLKTLSISIFLITATTLATLATACGSSEPEVVVQTVETIRQVVVTSAPERIVETVVVQEVVEKEVVQTVEVERVVEKTVVETVEVEKIVEVTAEAEEPATDESMTMMMTDDGQIPRNRQLVLLWGGSGGVGSAGQYTNHDIWNVYGGLSHQDGGQLIFEPLAFYSAFNDTEYPWLAESWEYNDDFTQLTINTRDGITWSDGTPFGAHDVAYTLDYLLNNSGLARSGQVQKDVESVEQIDDNTVVVNFLGPRPKFFYFMTYKFDIGLYIVPKHIFEGEDWLEFSNFDLQKGWPVTTGPWEVVQTSPEQKILNRRDSWWAVEQGLVDVMPEVLQIVYLPNPGETQMAQGMIANRADASLSLQTGTMREVLARNPAIITHSGYNPPYGYVDWWPVGLLFNASEPPYNDKRVRWAVSYYLNREQLIDVGFGGAGTLSYLPMPSYAPLQRYFDAVEDELAGPYDTTEYNPEKADALMMEAGYSKNSDGYWEKDGNVVICDILSFGIFNHYGTLVARQLDNAGIKSSYSTPPDAWSRQSAGEASCGLRGHGGSVRDPYFTMNLYYSTPDSPNAYHWSNDRFNELTDQVFATSIDDYAKLEELWTQAARIWLDELPDVQVLEFYHRIPMNTTYWTNWPTHDNPYTNGAFWHLTFQLILNNIKAVQS